MRTRKHKKRDYSRQKNLIKRLTEDTGKKLSRSIANKSQTDKLSMSSSKKTSSHGKQLGSFPKLNVETPGYDSELNHGQSEKSSHVEDEREEHKVITISKYRQKKLRAQGQIQGFALLAH